MKEIKKNKIFYQKNIIKVSVAITLIFASVLIFGFYDGLVVFCAIILFPYLLIKYIRFLLTELKKEKDKKISFREKSPHQKRLYFLSIIPVITLSIILIISISLSLYLSGSPFGIIFPESNKKIDSFSELEMKECRKLYNQKTQQSWKKAYESTCSELARYGNAEAQYYVGMIIKNSPDLPNYQAMAHTFFYVSSKNGYDGAEEELNKNNLEKKDFIIFLNMISNIYYSGTKGYNLIDKDDDKSFIFLEKSAELGNNILQKDLCISYVSGSRGEYIFNKNYVKAYKWCYLANLDPQIKNNNRSQKVFNKLKSLMTKEQIIEGEKLANEWIKNNSELTNNNSNKKPQK